MDSELSQVDTEINQTLITLKELVDRRRKIKGVEKRLTLFPFKTNKENVAWNFYLKQQMALWTPNELKFNEDLVDYNGLSDDLKRFIDIPFAFFAIADGDIIDELSFRFLLETEEYHDLCYYLIQLYIETVHADTYNKMILHLIPEQSKREYLLNSIQNIPIVKKIHDWIGAFMTGNYSAIERFAAAAVMEGIIFQSPFLFIFFFKTMGKMKTVQFANQQISKDEGGHANRGADKVKTLLEELPLSLRSEEEKKIMDIVNKGRELAKEFSLYVMTRDDGSVIELEALKPEYICSYVDLISNTLLYRFGMEQVYEVNKDNIPTWMSVIADQVKNNFYEISGGNYSQFSNQDIQNEYASESEDTDDVDF